MQSNSTPTLPTESTPTTTTTQSNSTPTLPAKTTPATSTDAAKIVGGVSAGVVFLLIIVISLLWRRQHAVRQQSRDGTIDPFWVGEHHSSHNGSEAAIDSFRVGEHHSSHNGSEAAESFHDGAVADSTTISNRNMQFSVPRRYRSGPDVSKNDRGKIKSGAQSQEEILRNLTSDVESRNAPVSSRATPRTPDILRHLDSGIRMFEVNTRRQSHNREIVGRSEIEDITEEMIELPPEYSRT
ncbi:hypothetical protein VKT23_012920 [Stygiomarasmius scandens]|uniref:Uncharacterized protein n=1 Tax=Marasmiellus scandens TaxID=2682957 RepID=A0ABR1J9N3_9AGAR